MEFKLNQFKDFIVIVGDNDSGKTTMMQKFILANMKKDKIIILNSSRQKDWADYIPIPKNIIKPAMFTKKWFEMFLLDMVSSKKDHLLVLDDVDNYGVKKSEVFKSVVINARHLNMGMVVAVRSLQELPILFYKQARYIFISRQLVFYDRQYIAFTIGRKNADKLENLEKYAFGVFDRKTNEFEIIKLKV